MVRKRFNENKGMSLKELSQEEVNQPPMVKKAEKLSKLIRYESKKQMTIKDYMGGLTTYWQFWITTLVLTFGTVGFAATSILLSSPKNPNCSNLYLPFSSATNRIYCAQFKAESKSVEGLLEAIALLTKLSDNHPLKDDISRYINEWGNEIIVLAEAEFQEGKLDKAIEIVEKIPAKAKLDSVIQEKKDSWKAIWKQGEEIQLEVEKQLRLGNWSMAFGMAIKFLNIPNQYFQTTKYQEVVNTINLAREENKKLDGAYAALKRRGVDNLLEAIKIAQAIPSSSYSYDQATKIIEDAKKEILDYAQEYISDKKWDSLNALAAKIPPTIDLKKYAEDWSILASGGINANLGTVEGLNLAIASVSNIDTSSQVYGEAKQLIELWQVQKMDLTYLVDAKNLAQPGDINSLNQAIAKAKLVNYQNPLYNEAQREIKTWQRQIERIEDQPYLDKAKQLAQQNNIAGWQEAINQASLISGDRALYSEAQGLINDWKNKIERIEDQPFLDQAMAYSNDGNFQAAIDAANQIRSGRVLYREAQDQIRDWRRQIRAQNNLNQAYAIAKENTPESLLRAINLARKVPSSANVRGESRIAINRWSEQLLSIARSLANYSLQSSLEQAIATAEMIPYGTSAYNSAREDIASWRNMLNPQTPVLPESPSSDDSNYIAP